MVKIGNSRLNWKKSGEMAEYYSIQVTEQEKRCRS